MSAIVYGKFTRYIPTEQDDAWDIYKTISAIFLMDKSGKDWYALQPQMMDKHHFVVYEQGGRIIQYADDPSKIWPDGCWVACLDDEDIPKGFIPKSQMDFPCWSWRYYRGKICKYSLPEDVRIKMNSAKKKQLLDEAFAIMKPLEFATDLGEASDVEKGTLLDYKRYCMELGRIELNADPDEIEWPTKP